MLSSAQSFIGDVMGVFRTHALSIEISVAYPDKSGGFAVKAFCFASAGHYGILVKTAGMSESDGDVAADFMANHFSVIAAYFRDTMKKRKRRDIFPPIPEDDAPIEATWLSYEHREDGEKIPEGSLVLQEGTYIFVAETGIEIDEFFRPA
jgi:hypothetical protein